MVITGELAQQILMKKFIPVLRSGAWTDSLPTYLQSKLGVDLSGAVDSDVGVARSETAPSRARYMEDLDQHDQAHQVVELVGDREQIHHETPLHNASPAPLTH